MADEKDAAKPPVQRQDIDLSQHENNSPSPLSHGLNAEYRSPAAMMREMGFDPDTGDLTPLQFLCAVMNDDLDKVFRQEIRRGRYNDKGGIGIKYRIECAKTAAKYLHMQMPNVTVQEDGGGSFGNQLARAVTQGHERVRTKRVILETVERISPDMPLPEANYPPAFSQDGQKRPDKEIIEATAIYDDIGPAEGSVDYDPDRDD